VDYNPHLKPRSRPAPNEVGGKGRIERPEAAENIVWQTRWAPPTEYENRLGDALEACFADGIADLEPLIARLNEVGVLAPDGQAWTTGSFEREMDRLGG